MAKIQVYVNDHVSEKINAIAVQRRAEGAKEKDVSYSSIASMLLELDCEFMKRRWNEKNQRLIRQSLINFFLSVL